MNKAQVGIVGLGTMGENLALNIESKGFPVAVFNRTPERVTKFIQTYGKGRSISPATSIQEFTEALEAPRVILVMVKAGPSVDEVVMQLTSHLAEGDVLIDGGNSHFRDTERRIKELAAKRVYLLGTGISGGEEGALKGPCIMAGGPEPAYALARPILTKIAAQTEDGPCCAYLGPGGAGHYVKMVHNGIEYAVIQLIAETYDIMQRMLGLAPKETAKTFSDWNKDELGSYLIGITADVLARVDEETSKPLVDLISDKAEQKGTGKWTSQDALDLGVPIPTIDAAVSARIMSSLKDERLHAAQVLKWSSGRFHGESSKYLDALRAALYCSVIVSYAQGLGLLKVASKEYGFGTNLADTARIWKGGCIIRSRLLNEIQGAFERRADLPNILTDPKLSSLLLELQEKWRFVAAEAKLSGIPCPAMDAALDYFDSFRSVRLPANLIQALRDYFGAHTYERIDKPGRFHTNWKAT